MRWTVSVFWSTFSTRSMYPLRRPVLGLGAPSSYHPLEAEDRVIYRERLAIVPFNALTEGEGERFAIVARHPAFRQVANHLGLVTVDRVKLYQLVIDRANRNNLVVA